ncbi:MAG TPA: hypothetical protein VGK67_00270 [Myxococcales bacterium]|jgi:hypothetical protein
MNPTTMRPAPLSTTGIGSLPHTQLEMALQQALSTDVPYLPELPKRTPNEAFAAQVLEPLPGLRILDGGQLTVDFDAWHAGAFALDAKLDEAKDPGNFEPFLPSATSASAWQPFVFEIESRKVAFAKVQCAGPATVLASLAGGVQLPERLERQVLNLVIHRAMAMAWALRVAGAVPIVFLDEPVLGAVRKASKAEQERELEHLRHTVLGLRNEGAITGIHCCGEADWAPLLRLGLDVLSFDATISLEKLLVSRPDVERFLETGGWFGLGVVPTDARTPQEFDQRLETALTGIEKLSAPLRGRILSQSLLTPACGLGCRTVGDVERVFEALIQAQARLRALKP